jgi:type IV pilus assembly protein PilY1
MKSVKKLTALVLIAALMLVQLHPAAFADDSDIFGANVQPNVLILIDTSGSMAESVTAVSYAAGTTYDVVNKCGSKKNQACTSTVVYQSGKKDAYTQYATTVSAVNDAGAQTALNTVGYWSGKISGSTVNLFMGNYLNYQIGFCASGNCLAPKIDIAKRVMKKLVESVKGVRFGVMKFWNNGSQGQGGGDMVAEIGSTTGSIQAKIDQMSPFGYTPLGEFLYDAGLYYKGQALQNGSTYTGPIQLVCQPNFVILITDGLENGTKKVGTEATNRYTQDHASGLSGTQNVIVHTVGFGITAGEQVAANDVLKTAAANGGGTFYDTNDETALEAALQDAIRRIVSATFTFATPVLPTTSTTGSSKAYLASFKSDASRPFWQGFLKAYQRGSDGLVPVDSNGVPLDSAMVWEAGQVLNATPAANRTISTVVSGSQTTFTKSNAAITHQLLGTSASERDKIIDYIRGVDAYDENLNGNTTEERGWKLGDIFHATPVLVTPPVLALNDSSYQAFRASKASRTMVLIAGSNDGMLHAFKETDGTELWAFIPPDLLSTLKDLTVTSGDHPFFVDSSPIAADVKISGVWKTIVVFGLRRGGNIYYALDITDTTSPVWMWSFTDTKMGETWSEPAIGKVKVGGVDKFVAFVGGGYDSGSNNAFGKALFVIDLATGEKLWEYYNDGTSDDRQYMNFSIPANPTAVDLTGDGYVDRVYLGDVAGQVWKFDVSAGATSSWTGKRLFAAPLASGTTNPPAAGEYYPAQAIYGTPSLALAPDLKLWVFFGTGDRNHPNSTTAPNRFYGIKDTTNMTNGSVLTESSLADVTSSNATAPYGWFFRLGSNEKVLATANVFNMNVIFSSFTPTTTVTCTSGGGAAKLYSVQVLTGYAGVDFSTGTALTTTDSSATRSATIGGGIASMPIIVITPPTTPGGKASSSAITGTTNQQLLNNTVPAPAFLKQVRSWRERIQ